MTQPGEHSARYAAERERNDKPVAITLHTRVPSKWLFTDRETGDVWVWRHNTFKQACPACDLGGNIHQNCVLR